MVYITLDDQQARIFAEATHEVAVRDASGKHLGYITSGFTLEDLREAELALASEGSRYTTAEVLAHLKSLETASLK